MKSELTFFDLSHKLAIVWVLILNNGESQFAVTDFSYFN